MLFLMDPDRIKTRRRVLNQIIVPQKNGIDARRAMRRCLYADLRFDEKTRRHVSDDHSEAEE